MSQEAVERALGRLITDERFRRSAVEFLEVTCLQEGYSLTPTELRLLSGQDLNTSPSLPVGLTEAYAGQGKGTNGDRGEQGRDRGMKGKLVDK